MTDRASSVAPLAVTAAFAAVAVFVALWFPYTERRSAFAALEHKAENQARLIAYTIAPAVDFGDEQSVAEAFRGAQRDVDFVGISATAPNGTTVAHLGASTALTQRANQLLTEAPIVLPSGAAGVLRLVMSADRIDAQSRRQSRIAGAIAATIVALGIAIALSVARSFRRIAALMRENDRERAAAEHANAVKSRFLANMSHEIRTPLNGVLGLADVLSRRRLDVETSALVGTIGRSARTLLALVNDVLDLSRVEAGRFELERAPFDARAAAHAVSALFAPSCQQRGVALVVEVGVEVPRRLLGDRLRFEQIVSNLVGNAVKFTSHGTVTLTLEWHAGSLSVSVRDTGIGIATDKHAAVFEAFAQADTSTTRRYCCSGLGLAISSQLVAQMGGEITLVSEPGVGSTFSFAIALDEAAATSDTPAREISASPTAPLRAHVLLAEDDETNQLVAGSFLLELGVSCETVSDGLQAVARATSGTRFDIILMDCQMPELDGYEATRRIRRWELETGRTRTPVVAVTAHALPVERARAAAAGMDGYVTKPLTLESFRAAMAEHVVDAQPIAKPTNAAPRLRILDQLGNDRVLLARIRDSFARGSSSALLALAEALGESDWRGIEQHAHTLKGSCLSLGATEAGALALALEGNAKARDTKAASETLVELEFAVEDVRATLDEAVGEPEADALSA